MKKTRIIVLTSSFPRNPSDWWAQFVLNTYSFLPHEKYDITVVAPHAPMAKRSEKIKGLKVKRFPYFYPYQYERLTSGEGILHNKGDFLSKLQIICFLFAETFFFFVFLLRKKYDIIHAHWIIPQGLIAACMRYLFHTPVVVTIHGSDVFGLQKLNFLKAFVLRNIDVCTANSQATYDAAKHLCANANVVLIPMGVDISIFKRSSEKKQTQTRTILAVGRLIRCKGYRYLIQAFPIIRKTIKNIRVVIVGSGPQERYLRELAKKLGLEQSVIFFGNLRHRELAAMYKESTIFVAPAVTDPVTGEREAQGLAILEAMASGVPVVASRSGGIRHIIEDKKTGVLVQEKDVKGIAREVVAVLRNKKRQNQMTSAAIVEVRKKYSWAAVAKQFDSLFDTITK